MLVLFIAGLVSIFTFLDATGCFSSLASAGGSAAVYMVLARWDSVGTTTCRHNFWVRSVDNAHTLDFLISLLHRKFTNVGVIKAPGDQALIVPELPSSCRVATITPTK